MHDPLAPLLHDGVVDEVCARLKSGKEADLWLVRHGGEVVAAKVYKAREARNFKNNASYREGRQVRDSRTQRAMDRGTRFGQAAAEEAWKAKESDALHQLHAAGVRVPRPVMFYEGVLLMELVTDAHGHPAPRLVDAHVAREDAAALYADLRGQAIRMLACDLIHGDLSPYNILLGRDGPVVIDFPQVVGAAHNSQAESFFRRDLENVRRFFAAIDPALGAAEGDAREIWRAYVRRELTPDFVPTGRPEPRGPDRGHGARQQPHGHGGRHPREQGPRQPQGQGPRQPQGQSPRQGPRQSHGQGPQRQGSQQPQGQQGPRHPRAQGGRPPHGNPPARPEPVEGRAARGATPPPKPGSDRRPPQPGRGPGSAAPPRGPDRRRDARPAPEVVRVTRPPLGGPGQPPASAPSRPHGGGQGGHGGGHRGHGGGHGGRGSGHPRGGGGRGR